MKTHSISMKLTTIVSYETILSCLRRGQEKWCLDHPSTDSTMCRRLCHDRAIGTKDTPRLKTEIERKVGIKGQGCIESR